MSDSNSAVLQRAFELVEAGQAEEARSLVESVLEAEQSNPDAWWIYAHAVEDPVKARQALNEVLALDPDYPGANELAGVLDAQYPDAADAARNAAPLLLAAAPGLVSEVAQPAAEAEASAGPELAEEPDAEPAFVSEVPPAAAVLLPPPEKEKRTPWGWLLVGLLGILALLIVVFLIGRPSTPQPAATQSLDATQIAGQPTLDVAALSAQETAVAAGLLTPETGVATAETGGEATADGAEGTSEPLVSGVGETQTPEPAQTLVIATLPIGAVATLTPSVPEVASTEAVQPTDAATAIPEVTEPVPVVTVVEATPGISVPDAVVVIIPADTLNQIVTALSAVSTPPESSLVTESTTLGETLVAGFCTQDGPELRDLTRQVMDTVAAAAPVMADTTAAVGVRAVDCETGQTLRLIVADRGAATLYTQGEINREGFESQWLSL